MIFIAEPYREILGKIGTSPETIFTDPAIKPWRILEDRQNCTWDVVVGGRRVRLHVKRFGATRRRSWAEAEAEGYRALHERGIASANVAAWGRLDDGRSFIATEDLAGFAPADKLVEGGVDFDRFLISTADLTARLHNAGLHHRDLYLCHFLARGAENEAVELRLIDAARVRALPRVFMRRRWIVKDLAQFWYSTTQLPVTDLQRDVWLARYAQQTNVSAMDRLRRSIVRKAKSIAAHDRRLRVRRPGRNISIPKSG
ncbi:MAG: lipopolysaccharide kinase InaA family protein [Tepidisphaeraceae bacterium]